ncbi:hypothetical protein MARLIPOL_17793 [Marinobacter lipolyticus SM19]|uniref:DUF4124 domain-containing protein n=1 Tax=Marinobacter lipolyticus SM19 TaxID=1318628 RepID=R8AWB2_9GAMM|nr:DUF4124 domain-containing protein [Marinobacter lipolyticus]EON90624.1 hypothetical protein MARLIPOL_17793 [Marinobacter lipolyticus SM19]
MNLRLGLISGILVFIAVPTMAEVYRNVDAQGNVTYSDEPSDGAEEVKVKPVTTITLPKPADVREPDKLRKEVEKEGSVYDSVRILAPKNDEAFHSGSGDVAFRVTSAPGLRTGHRYEITLDGQPVGQTTSDTLTVRNVFRGTHNAGVHIIDEKGVQVKTGDSVRFTIHRPSVNN